MANTALEFEKDCSIGDLEYDSDMQIARLYVKCFKNKASLKEFERLLTTIEVKF